MSEVSAQGLNSPENVATSLFGNLFGKSGSFATEMQVVSKIDSVYNAVFAEGDIVLVLTQFHPFYLMVALK